MPHFGFPPRELLTGLGRLVQADEKMQSWEPPACREAFGPDVGHCCVSGQVLAELGVWVPL